MTSNYASLKVVLDPTGLYPPAPNHLIIETEVDWLKQFVPQNQAFWIKGEKLCTWTEIWLQRRGQFNAIEILKKEPPRKRLRAILNSNSIPADWSEQKIFDLVNQLYQYPSLEDPIPYFLAEITYTDLSLWQGSPSKKHLAQWLTVTVPEEYKILEDVWKTRFRAHRLRDYYLTEDKRALLKNWLGIGVQTLDELGVYPLPLPDILLSEFRNYWETQILRTEGGIIDELSLQATAGKEEVVNQIYRFFIQRPQWCTREREQKVAPYFTDAQKLALQRHKPPQQPAPLTPDASPEAVLKWVTTEYLPFRYWEIVKQERSQTECISTKLAESFVVWLLEQYPGMASTPVAQSLLNYSTFSTVNELSQANPVLWVVVDGLGWLDHGELLEDLKAKGLQLDREIAPKFSILPTLTGYAKWSLFSQLLPNDPTWVEDAGQGFPETPSQKRYTDNMEAALLSDIRVGNRKIYCWDTTELDELFHHSGDWCYLHNTRRPDILRSIATRIIHLVNEFEEPANVSVVIASDHGQIMGASTQLAHCPKGLTPRGRMAEGLTDDCRFTALEPSTYPVPKTMSVVLGPETLSNINYRSLISRIGSHGGLFPEEVVVGVSVLKQHIQRKLPLVICQGEGKPGEPGALSITIDNQEELDLRDLWLQVNEIPALAIGVTIPIDISANDRITTQVPIKFPEASMGLEGNSQTVKLTGSLTFHYRYAETATAPIDTTSKIIINTMFSSGLDIDEFL